MFSVNAGNCRCVLKSVNLSFLRFRSVSRFEEVRDAGSLVMNSGRDDGAAGGDHAGAGVVRRVSK